MNLNTKNLLVVLMLGLLLVSGPQNAFTQVLVKGSSNFFVGYGYPSLAPEAEAAFGKGSSSSSLGPIVAAYQYGLSERFALGVLVEYATGTTSNVKWTAHGQDYSFDGTITILTITAKADFHYLRSKKIDLYSGFAVGYGRGSAVFNGQENPDIVKLEVNPFGYAINALGFRYMFSRHLGVFTEVGYANISMVTLGLSSILGNNRQWWEH